MCEIDTSNLLRLSMTIHFVTDRSVLGPWPHSEFLPCVFYFKDNGCFIVAASTTRYSKAAAVLFCQI